MKSTLTLITSLVLGAQALLSADKPNFIVIYTETFSGR